MHSHAINARWGEAQLDPRALWLAMSGHRGGRRGRPHHRVTAADRRSGPGFGRGPRARRGDVRAALLVLLAEEPRNGYGLMQEIEARSDGAWRPSPGSVYPALSQLEDEGLVQRGGVRRTPAVHPHRGGPHLRHGARRRARHPVGAGRRRRRARRRAEDARLRRRRRRHAGRPGRHRGADRRGVQGPGGHPPRALPHPRRRRAGGRGAPARRVGHRSPRRRELRCAPCGNASRCSRRSPRVAGCGGGGETKTVTKEVPRRRG